MRSQNSFVPLFALCLFALLIFAAQSPADPPRPTDYLAADSAALQLEPGGPAIAFDDGSRLRLMLWEVSQEEARILPGTSVTNHIELEWTGAHPRAPLQGAIFGSWLPNRFLAQPWAQLSERGEAGLHRWTPVFVAPKTPGRYRVRITFVPAATSISGFYSNPDLGVDAPGRAWWAERTIEVAEP